MASKEQTTNAYDSQEWVNGETLSASKLLHIEQGITQNNVAVRALEQVKVQVTMVASDAPATGSYTTGVFSFELPKGEKGDQGPQGTKGEKGEKGEQGIQGPQGETGQTGATGPTGPQGPKGDTGAQGPKGDTGAQGPKGDPGEKGEKGDTGATGAKGATGAAGKDGKNGASLRVTTAAVTASSANNKTSTGVTPSDDVLPIAVGDLILDGTNKKLYAVTAVAADTYTVGAVVATLP